MAECKESTKFYTLTLSEEEAIFLGRLIGHHTCGSGKMKYIRDIFSALEKTIGLSELDEEVDLHSLDGCLDIKEPM